MWHKQGFLYMYSPCAASDQNLYAALPPSCGHDLKLIQWLVQQTGKG